MYGMKHIVYYQFDLIIKYDYLRRYPGRPWKKKFIFMNTACQNSDKQTVCEKIYAVFSLQTWKNNRNV